MGATRVLVGAKRCFILVTSPTDNRMVLPQVFSKHCNENVPSTVHLVTGEGVFDVNVSQERGSTFFANGWADFRDACNISAFNMMLLVFDDPHIINVAIFHADGSENEVNFGSLAQEVQIDDQTAEKFGLISAAVGDKDNDSMAGTSVGAMQCMIFSEQDQTARTVPLSQVFQSIRHGIDQIDKNLNNQATGSGDAVIVGNKRARSATKSSSSDTSMVKSSDTNGSDEGCNSAENICLTQKVPETVFKSVTSPLKNIPTNTSFRAGGFLGRVAGKHCEFTVSIEDIAGKLQMDLPISFGRDTMKLGNNIRTLDVIGSQKWSITCVLEPERCFITQGWMTFVTFNNVTPGDTILFLEDSSDAAIWIVVIIKNK